MSDVGSLYGEALREGDYWPAVTAYYFKQWIGYTMPQQHTHVAVEIMYAISGTCRVEVDDEHVSLRRGDFILLESQVPHKLIVEDSCRMLNVEFTFVSGSGNGSDAAPSLRRWAQQEQALARLLRSGRTHIVLRDPVDVYHTLRGLVLELDRPVSGGSGLMVAAQLLQLLVRVARVADWAERSDSAQAGEKVKLALDYLHQHYDCDVQIKDIAAAAGVHPGYLHRIFNRHCGETVMAYLNKLRMDKARMLLAQTDIPIIEISGYVGMNSSQYFSTAFKKATGRTPAQYRKSASTFRRTEDGGPL